MAAQAQRLALAWAVDRQRVEAAERELHAGEEHVHLLAVVEPVEQHDRRRGAPGDRGLQEVGGERGILVGDVHDLQAGVAALQPLLGVVQRLAVDGGLQFARRDHALAGVVVLPRAQVVIARGGLVAGFSRFVALGRDLVGYPAPFLVPRLRFVGALVQRLHDPVDLAQRDRAVRRHALAHERRIRPLEVVGEAVDPVARVEHAASAGCRAYFVHSST